MKMVLMKSVSTSMDLFCPALARAERTTLETALAPTLGVCVRIFRASSTFFPRMRSALSRVFCGDKRRYLATARVSMMPPSGRLRRCLQLGFPVPGMAEEGAGGRKFSQFIPYHVFRHKNRNELLAVVDGESLSDHLRKDGRTPGPRFDDLTALRPYGLFNLFHQMRVHKRALANGTCHVWLLYVRSKEFGAIKIHSLRTPYSELFTLFPSFDDKFISSLVLPGLISPRGNPPGSNRMTPPGAFSLAAPQRVVHWVNGHPPNPGIAPQPSAAPGFSQGNIFMIQVSHLPHGGITINMDQPHLPGRKLDMC